MRTQDKRDGPCVISIIGDRCYYRPIMSFADSLSLLNDLAGVLLDSRQLH